MKSFNSRIKLKSQGFTQSKALTNCFVAMDFVTRQYLPRKYGSITNAVGNIALSGVSSFSSVQKFSFFKTLFVKETLVVMVRECEFDLITIFI